MEEIRIAPPPSAGDGAPALTPCERYLLTFPEGMRGDLTADEALIDMSVTILHERLFGLLFFRLVDPERREAAFYRLAEGRYRAVPLRDGLFHSEVVPGFRPDPQVLFQDPLPNEFDVLRRLLQPGAPA